MVDRAPLLLEGGFLFRSWREVGVLKLGRFPDRPLGLVESMGLVVSASPDTFSVALTLA